MQTVDLVVLPSHREGVPRGLLEAASMELPIIATDVPGCREIVENGRNGFLIPVNDAPALAAKITELFADPVLCRKFGREGRLKVRNEFEQKLVFEQTVHVYRAAGLPL
jgi:glycosyltransferase involved in cell wall biosynthesis